MNFVVCMHGVSLNHPCQECIDANLRVKALQNRLRVKLAALDPSGERERLLREAARKWRP